MKLDKNQEEKIDEFYRWYKRVKVYVFIWMRLSEWILFIGGIILIIKAWQKLTEIITTSWPEISIDAKFGGAITLLVFVLGIFIGRNYKGNKKS